MKIWEKGFSVNDKIEKFTVGQDRELDMYLAPFDMLASKAQAKMLASVGLISQEEETQLLTGLDELLAQVENGTFVIRNGRIEAVGANVAVPTGAQTIDGRGRMEVMSVALPVKMLQVEGFRQKVVRFTTDIPHLPNWGTPLLLGAGSILVAHTKDHIAVDPLDEHAHAPGEGPSDPVPEPSVKAGDEADESLTPPPRQRVIPGAAPNRIRDGQEDVREDLQDAKRRARESGGEYQYDGHKPRSAEERLRAGVPYSEYYQVGKSLMSRIQVCPY